MNKFSSSIAVLVFSIVSLTAQNNADAQKVIDKLTTSIQTTAVKTNFELLITEKNAVNSQPVLGTFVMKANKFTLDVNETKAWFDGKTQWTYLRTDNEVTITEPTVDELAQINPMIILASFKVKSWVRFGKTKSANAILIELVPKNKKDDFTKIEVLLDKKSTTPKNIRIVSKNKSVTSLKMMNYRQIDNLPAETFTFNKNKYKNTLINDLR
ncbi:MAG: hypothetical protein AUK44_04280 [Porphyromonadaceae bacterium CG2_30_38_12]|nr:MAG: hypothetical protein AUK44_04280 [Porphyromonadaceae bacterium CG2_30_38_12]